MTVEQVLLHEATRWRYLNYAMSVITSRALPDVRDGLKPVQRRILYAMYHNLRLLPDKRFRKSAAVVGEVMAKYHPHGDSAIYEAMVRMAQPFALRHTLVDGQGNFGSMDGDSAAAMRYTECKLTYFSLELLKELGSRTVSYRPTYDGQLLEPILLPARVPHLLVNGSEGIAVGMATRIPPHNLREVIGACLLLIDDRNISISKLCNKIKGPDFPTGGIILNTRQEVESVYTTGSGSIHVQSSWEVEKSGRKAFIVIQTIPYALNKASIVEKIGNLIASRKIPQLLDVRDESTETVRIVLELRAIEDAKAAMAYLFKHTALQQSFHVNLTALIPSSNPEVAVPSKLDLKSMLCLWLDFRYDTVRKRYEYELEKLLERIHILEGFEKIFVDLDEAIKIIRNSEGRRDSAENLMDRFNIDDIQAEAILELKLYRLSKLEIIEIQAELAECRKAADRIEIILSDPKEIWVIISEELRELAKKFGDPRRTKVGCEEDQLDYNEEAYIVAEDTFVVVTCDGWIKRQNSYSSLEKIRVREGDSVGWFFQASTLSNILFFTNLGSAYVLKVDEIQLTTGYGGPIQKHFQFADGERIISIQSLDPRNLPKMPQELVQEDLPHCIAISKCGKAIRFALSVHSDVSTKSGRRFFRLADGDYVVDVCLYTGGEFVSLASEQGRVLNFLAEEINFVKAAGKGVTAMKLRAEDSIFAYELTWDPEQGAKVITSKGREVIVNHIEYGGSRGDKGTVILKKASFQSWERPSKIVAQEEEGDEQ